MSTTNDLVDGQSARPHSTEDNLDLTAMIPRVTPDPALPTSHDPEQLHRRLVLQPRQQQALEWLTGGGTLTEAAELVGVSRQTVSHWVNHDPAFGWLYRQWQEHQRDNAESRALGLVDAAIDNLIAAIRRGDLKASQFVLRLLGIGSRRRQRQIANGDE